ncbi:MAG: hypothetical protein R6U94_14080 [Nitriliruptoraceae bacterium]
MSSGSSLPQRRSRLLRRLAWLRNLEWCNIPFLAVVLLWWVPAAGGRAIPTDTWVRTLAFLPVAGLLLVGGWYWHRKLLQLRHGRAIDSALAILDRLDRWLPWLLTAWSLALVGAWLVRLGTATDRWWAAGFLAFAWAEFINYFRVQLMHDTRSDLERLITTRRLRRSWLATDLAGWRGTWADP